MAASRSTDRRRTGPSAPREPGAPGQGAGYAIGTVAGLTGLDPHTIRAWERRYRAVSPVRSPGGSRRYGTREVTRLQLLKALVDCGEPIGAMARLGDDAIRTRLAELAGMARSGADSRAQGAPLTIALLAPGLLAQLRLGGADLGRLRVTLSSVDRDEFLSGIGAAGPDVVVAELRALGAEPLQTLESLRRASRARLVVVLYDFAAGAELARLARAGAHLVHGPLRLAQVRRAIEDLLVLDAATKRALPAAQRGAEAPAAPPARRFDDAQLAALLETTGAVKCECPSHLASLVTSLVAFERYSRDCENRDEEDAALHRRITGASSRVRAELEALLDNVCRHEGIRI